SHILFENCTTSDRGSRAMQIDRCDNITVANCTLPGIRTGIDMYGSATKDCIIRDCNITGKQTADLEIRTIGTGNIFRNNTLKRQGLILTFSPNTLTNDTFGTSNTVAGEPLRVIFNATGTINDMRSGQVLLVEPRDLVVNNGSAITGYTGMQILKGSNVTLIGLNVSGFNTGLSASSTEDLTLLNCTFFGGTWGWGSARGLSLSNVLNATVINCTMYVKRSDMSTTRGFQYAGGSVRTTLTVENCSIGGSLTDLGMSVSSGTTTDIVIRGCWIHDCDNGGISISGARSLQVLDNRFSVFPGTEGETALSFSSSGRVEIVGNEIDRSYHGIAANSFGELIVANNEFSRIYYTVINVKSSNSWIHNNTINGWTGDNPNSIGIWLAAHNNTCVDNTFIDVRGGIWIRGNRTLVQRCEIDGRSTSFGNAIYLDEFWEDVRKDIVILDCTINHSMFGVRVGRNMKGLWINNTTISNCQGGIDIRGKNEIRVTYSTITDSGTAILVDGGTNNTFHHNNFIRNNYNSGTQTYRGRQCRADADNSWDNGSEGNYWADYTQHYPGATNDGVFWDTPYDVGGSGINLDRFPFVNRLDYIKPIADAGENMTIDQETRIAFDGSGSFDNLGIVSYIWNVSYRGNFYEIEGIIIYFTFNIPGVYKVDLTVMDASQNHGTDSIWVTVIDTEAPDPDAGPDMTVLMNEEFTLSGHHSNDNVAIVTYEWIIQGEGDRWSLEGSSVNLTIHVPGTYTAELRCYDRMGNNATDKATITVLDIIPPVALAGSNIVVDMGETIHLDG
ncbi:MAG: right-handed parallel beta-helix repeat-containing protein, partial [Thermoplasmata archaeon]|nr:right-handed parallel beta-helix repeat-containing protein [Thermoplasmata archaeon]